VHFSRLVFQNQNGLNCPEKSQAVVAMRGTRRAPRPETTINYKFAPSVERFVLKLTVLKNGRIFSDKTSALQVFLVLAFTQTR
jgi:hypothetical protein